jgi:hypothetical protein
MADPGFDPFELDSPQRWRRRVRAALERIQRDTRMAPTPRVRAAILAAWRELRQKHAPAYRQRIWQQEIRRAWRGKLSLRTDPRQVPLFD